MNKDNEIKKKQNEDDEYKSLEETREFRKIETKNGNLIVRYSPKIHEGLTDEQVLSRAKDGLINRPKHHYNRSYLQIIIKNVCTYLNFLLFFIFALLIIAQCNVISNYFFMIIICSNLVIGVAQEIRAKKILDQLSLVTKSKSKVIRNAQELLIENDDVVLDDIIKLTIGDKIISDGVIVEGEVEVNESLLTGESLPIKKCVGDNIFAGSFISSGTCIYQVERVGEENYVTKLQEKAKKEKKNNSVILKSLNLIIGVVSICVLPFGTFTFLSAWAKESWILSRSVINEILIKTCASMIAMIPSGLYLTTSVSLLVSIINLAKKKTLVQDSYAIEMLARSNVLCLDKTGTITDGTMILEKEISYSKDDYSSIVGDLLNAFEEKNATSLAILQAHQPTNQYSIIDKVPFSSSRKMSLVKFDHLGWFVLGAPEFILDNHHQILKELDQYTLLGYRVLLLAHIEEYHDDQIFGKIEPLNAYLIKDHIRDDAPDTIKWFQDNGVEIKIISGDNPLTVSEIAAQVGVKNADKYISLEGKSLEEVKELANVYAVFGRVAPEQKAILVSSLKEKGKTVAMTGDGVNDILALKKADCSIALASGAKAAQNVASIVLINSSFSSLPHVVSEGRRVINNITEVASLFLMKTIFAFILTLSTLYPFNPNNLITLEVFSIGLAAFLLALQPNNRQIKGGFLKNVLSKALPGGLSYALGVICLVLLCRNNIFGLQEENIQTICGIFISIMGLLTLLFSCIPFNKYRSLVYFTMCLCTFLVIFVPFGKNISGFATYSLDTISVIVLIAAILIYGGLFVVMNYLFKLGIRKYEEKQNKN